MRVPVPVDFSQCCRDKKAVCEYLQNLANVVETRRRYVSTCRI